MTCTSSVKRPAITDGVSIATPVTWCAEPSDLKHTYMKKFSQICDQSEAHFKGDRISITELYGKEIVFETFKNITIKGDQKLLVQFRYQEEGETYVFITKSEVIKDKLQKYQEHLPFQGTINLVKNYVTIQ